MKQSVRLSQLSTVYRAGSNVIPVAADHQRNTLVLIGSVTISLDYVIGLIFGIDLPSWLTLNWIVFPLILLVDFTINPNKYFSASLLKWIWFFVVVYCLFLLTDSDSDVPRDMSPPHIFKAGMCSLIVFSFFYVNCTDSKSREALLKGLLVGSVILLLLVLIQSLGIIPGGLDSEFSKTGDIIKRVAGAGDPNISILYIVPGISAIPYLYSKKTNRFTNILAIVLLLGLLIVVITTASRSGILVASVVVIYFLTVGIRFIPPQQRYLLSVSITFIILYFCLHSLWFKSYQESCRSRLTYAVQEHDDSLYHRIDANAWLAKDLATHFRLFGMGYSQYHDEIGWNLPGGQYAIRYPHASLADIYIIGGAPLVCAWMVLWGFGFSHSKKLASTGGQIERSLGYFFFSMLLAIFLMHLGLSMLWIKLLWAVLGAAIGCKR